MLQKIKLTDILIVVLLAILLLQRCGGGKGEIGDVKIKRDTVWVHKDSTIITKPQTIGTIAVPIDRWNTEYLPDTNYTRLLAQYMDITNRFLASNIQNDSLKIDSIGYVKVMDTVSHNTIVSRKYTYSLKYPIITNTITVPEKKVNQLYFGVSLEGNDIVPLDQANAELLLKNKRDQIYGISIGIDRSGQVIYGIETFWKIKLHK